MRPSFGLPVSPGTPFFPFFSSLFVFCFGRRKWRIPEQLRRRGEAEAANLLRRRSPSSRSSRLFFIFSILAVENGGIRSCCIVGVGSSGKKKTAQPKTTSFWVGLIFF